MGVIPHVGGDYTKGKGLNYKPREGLESVNYCMVRFDG